MYLYGKGGGGGFTIKKKSRLAFCGFKGVHVRNHLCLEFCKCYSVSLDAIVALVINLHLGCIKIDGGAPTP